MGSWRSDDATMPFGIPSSRSSPTLLRNSEGNVGQEPRVVRGMGQCDRDTSSGAGEAELRGGSPLTSAVA